MKVGDFLPDITSRDAKLVQANEFLNKVYENGFSNFAKGYKGIESQVQPLGINKLCHAEVILHEKTLRIRGKPETVIPSQAENESSQACVETDGESISFRDSDTVRPVTNESYRLTKVRTVVLGMATHGIF